MATLQKIRNQGGILVSIFIGVALVAFIVGDALSSGSSLLSRSRNKVGEIAGETIDVQEFQTRLTRDEEMIKVMHQLPSLNEEQSRSVRETSWNQLVSDIILEQEFKGTGLGLGDKELYDLLLGEHMNQNLRQMFTDPNTGIYDPERARQTVLAISKLPDNHPDKQYWLFMENQIADAQRSQKYNALLLKGMYIPKVQAETAASQAGRSVDISFLAKSYSSISDSTINVSQQEIKEYYASHTALFQQQESRQITYVNFEVTPSATDITETEAWVKKLVTEFEEAPNVLEFARLTSEVRHNEKYLKAGELGDEAIDQFLFAGKENGVYGPYLKDNAYNIIRVADRKVLPDSVKARHILIQPVAGNTEAARHLADSLAGVLRKGGNFGAIARQYSADENSAINGGDLGWFAQGMMVQPFSDTAFFAKKNEIKIAETQFGIHIIQVTEQTKPVEKVLAGIISKEITPSQQTINQVYNQVRLFANNLKTYKDFDAAATENNYTKRIANISKNDHTIAGITNARELIRQAYLAESEGRVLTTFRESPIFESDNHYTVAVLTNIKKEGIRPVGEVSGQIRRELIRKKKGEILAKELKEAAAGSQSLLSVAGKTNTEVVDASDISFASFQVPGAGIEPKLVAGVVDLPEGTLSAPIIGNQAVYMAVVTSREELPLTEERTEESRFGLQQMILYRLLPPPYGTNQAMNALTKEAGVTDLRYKFF